MRITKSDLYNIEYYNLIRINEEREFIDFLNAHGLQEDISPFIMDIANAILEQINSSSPVNTMKRDASEIDRKLQEVISQSDGEKNIPSNILSNLFSAAYSKLANCVIKKEYNYNEKYFIESKVRYWLEDNLAERITKDDRFKSYENLTRLIEITEGLHHFYSALCDKLQEKWIYEQVNKWTEVKSNPESFLDAVRTFDKSYFEDYVARLKLLEASSPWNYISDATNYSDYAMFNEEYSFKDKILFNKAFLLWLLFWDNLRLPILQDITFHKIRKAEDYLVILEHITDKSVTFNTPLKHLACILMKNFVEGNLRIHNTLSFYVDENKTTNLSGFNKNEQILEKGKLYYQSWMKELQFSYDNFIKMLRSILDIAEIGEWIFSYAPRTGDDSQTKFYNIQIEYLHSGYSKILTQHDILVEIHSLSKNFNFQKFNFIVLSTVKANASESLYKEMLESLSNFVDSDKFYWDGTFKPMYWNAIKNLSLILSFTADPLMECQILVTRFKVHYEGWNIDSRNYKETLKETFIYCGISLLLEHPKAFSENNLRTEHFQHTLKHIISQSRLGISQTNNDYNLPLFLMGAIVNQVHPQFKLEYEQQIIQNVDDIDNVIKILGSSDELHDSSKALLENRLHKEFPFLKKELLQKGLRNDITVLEESIKNLGLKNE